MSNDLTVPDDSAISTASAQWAADLSDKLLEAAAYGLHAVEQGNSAEAAFAMDFINKNLALLASYHSLLPIALHAQASALQKVVEQRDELTRRYEVVKTTFDRQVKEAVNDTVEHLLTCGECYDEAHVEEYANRMLDEGFDEVEAEARAALERQLEAARQLAHHWQHEDGLESGPGIGSDMDFQPNPNYPDRSYMLDDDFDDDDDDLDPQED